MEIQKNLAFTREEYLGRVDRVRARMKEKGLDALLIHTPENICYLSGFQTSGYYFVQVLIVPVDKDPVFIVRALEKQNVDAWSWLADEQAIGYMDYDNPVDIVFKALSDRGLSKGRLGFEMDGYSFIPIARYEELKTRLAGAELVNGSGIVEKERATKSPAEVDYIRQACRITVLGMEAVRDNLRAGMTENELAGHVEKAVVGAGGEYAGLPMFMSSGWRTIVPHANPTDKVIETGDHVLTELTGVARRYAGPLFRTFSVGEPTELVAKNAAITEAILEAEMAVMRPGITSHDAHAVVGPATEKWGDPRIVEQARRRAGYSIGLNFPPDWGEGVFLDLKKDDPTVLEPGMVFHVPHKVVLPGEPVCAISETVVITEDGHEVLTHFEPRKLVVV